MRWVQYLSNEGVSLTLPHLAACLKMNGTRLTSFVQPPLGCTEIKLRCAFGQAEKPTITALMTIDKVASMQLVGS